MKIVHTIIILKGILFKTLLQFNKGRKRKESSKIKYFNILAEFIYTGGKPRNYHEIVLT